MDKAGIEGKAEDDVLLVESDLFATGEASRHNPKKRSRADMNDRVTSHQRAMWVNHEGITEFRRLRQARKTAELEAQAQRAREVSERAALAREELARRQALERARVQQLEQKKREERAKEEEEHHKMKGRVSELELTVASIKKAEADAKKAVAVVTGHKVELIDLYEQLITRVCFSCNVVCHVNGGKSWLQCEKCERWVCHDCSEAGVMDVHEKRLCKGKSRMQEKISKMIDK
jgi:hypothetical protein